MTSEPKKLQWMTDAACRDYEPAVFFTEGAHLASAYDKARRICGSCDVLSECAAYIATWERSDERHGFWAGLSPADRRKRTRRSQRAALRQRQESESQQLAG